MKPVARALAEFRLAQIHDRLENRSAAAERLRRFASLWRNLDSSGRALASRLERSVERLTPEKQRTPSTGASEGGSLPDLVPGTKSPSFRREPDDSPGE